MKQVVQNIRRGFTTVETVVDPAVASGEVLVAIRTSVISAGTERYIVELARKSLAAKAFDRTDQVRRTGEKIWTEGR